MQAWLDEELGQHLKEVKYRIAAYDVNDAVKRELQLGVDKYGQLLSQVPDLMGLTFDSTGTLGVLEKVNAINRTLAALLFALHLVRLLECCRTL